MSPPKGCSSVAKEGSAAVPFPPPTRPGSDFDKLCGLAAWKGHFQGRRQRIPIATASPAVAMTAPSHSVGAGISPVTGRPTMSVAAGTSAGKSAALLAPRCSTALPRVKMWHSMDEKTCLRLHEQDMRKMFHGVGGGHRRQIRKGARQNDDLTIFRTVRAAVASVLSTLILRSWSGKVRPTGK
jgi:hypothetical protein